MGATAILADTTDSAFIRVFSLPGCPARPLKKRKSADFRLIHSSYDATPVVQREDCLLALGIN